ncbi:hypothetical protein N1851_020032 [Merluccius polli]|uniref:Uncharacterized protein n=1 Tax=Merluccius polli TaxID=89951 RepID=A0AA47ML07_MERPO|nr:hypothetical protein N1851_020032 [Merluccius polli]
MRQTTLTECKALSKFTSEKLTDTIARWIAKDCRPINIVEDTGLAEGNFRRMLQATVERHSDD